MGHFGGVGAPDPMSQSIPPLYTGLFRHTLDDKNRLTIPSAWRFAHGENDTFLATPHPDGYVAVLPPAEVEKLRAKIAAMALSDGAGQDFVARFFAQTHSLWFDKAGPVGDFLTWLFRGAWGLAAITFVWLAAR